LVFSVCLVLAGFQAWKVVDALVQSEKTSYVPLPTREPAAAGAVPGLPTVDVTEAPDNEPNRTPKPYTPTPKPTETVAAIAAENTPTPVPTLSSAYVKPKKTATPVPTATATTAPTKDPPPPTATDEPPPPTATKTQAPDDDDGGSGRLDVINAMIDAVSGGNPGTSKVWDGATDLYILVVGVDRRPGVGDQNADVIVIAHLDLINERVAAVSIPRDLYVQIPGYGQDKINRAYDYGHRENPDDPVSGVVKVRDTVEDNFGIPIDAYVLVDFNGFKEVVDAAGGIDVNVPYEIIDTEYPTEDYGIETITFEPGVQHMNGDLALKYVRTRHADSDDQRRERQWQVMLALFDKGKSFGSVRNADEIILAAGQSVQTSFELDEQVTVAKMAYEMEPGSFRFSSLGPPILTGGYITEGGPWVYTGDPNQILAFITEGLKTDPEYFAAQPADGQ
jgi:LCP family protein required for cell wall assembly